MVRHDLTAANSFATYQTLRAADREVAALRHGRSQSTARPTPPPNPGTGFQVTDAPTSRAGNSPAAIGLPVMVSATLVGVERRNAMIQL